MVATEAWSWSGLARAAATAGVLLVLAYPAYVHADTSAGEVVAVLVWLGALSRDAAPRRARASLSAVVGLSAAATWALDPAQWIPCTMLVVLGSLVCREAHLERTAAAASVAVPLCLLAVTSMLGPDAAQIALRTTFTRALPQWPEGVAMAVTIAACVALAASTQEGEVRAELRAPVTLGVLATGLFAVVGLRGWTTVASLGIPTDTTQWSEPPLLANMARLRAGEPLYGEPDAVASFTYSPTLELLHSVLMAPLGRDLDIVAHRVLVLSWQLSAASVLGFAVWRSTDAPTLHRAARLGVVLTATLAVQWQSPASPMLHPDHPMHLVVAIAAWVALESPRWSARARAVSLAVLPAAAGAFKLTGIGVGLGFGLEVLRRRDWGLMAPLAASAVLLGALVVAYDALLGPFSSYAIGLMSAHRVDPSRLVDAACSGHGRLTMAALLAVFLMRRSARRGDGPAALGLLAIGVGATTMLAFSKEGGRENNLVAPLLPVLLGFAVLFDGRGRRDLVATLSGCTLAAVIPAPIHLPDASRMAAIAGDHAVAVRTVRAELDAGRRPLVHAGTTIWLEAGGAGPSGDLLHPAVELFLADHPAFDGHLARLAEGRFDLIVTPGETFVAKTRGGAEFGTRMQAAVAPRYCVVHPTDDRGAPVALDFGARLLILRRRDRGCAPVR